MAKDDLADARPLVAALLADALARRASDIHVDPAAQTTDIRLRIDGLLEPYASYPPDTGRAIVSRLMVLANLLTYRLDIPQEGRLEWPNADAPSTESSTLSPQHSLDLRLSIMPTTHGLRAALRLPADLLQPKTLEELALPEAVLAGLRQFAATDTGLLILTGPAGSGKTTTIYALLDYIRRASPGLSIVTLEDPVERDLPGVTQIEITPHGQLTYQRALRSILRQDPQVLMLGEIRDPETASLAIQAALSGHRLICTLHAGHPAAAIARLLEMALEPYQITSALFAIIAQRLVRKLRPTPHSPAYAGRIPAAEIVMLDGPLRAAILRRGDATELARIFTQRPGHVTMRQVAESLITRNLTDTPELHRIFGPAAS